MQADFPQNPESTQSPTVIALLTTRLRHCVLFRNWGFCALPPPPYVLNFQSVLECTLLIAQCCLFTASKTGLDTFVNGIRSAPRLDTSIATVQLTRAGRHIPLPIPPCKIFLGPSRRTAIANYENYQDEIRLALLEDILVVLHSVMCFPVYFVPATDTFRQKRGNSGVSLLWLSLHLWLQDRPQIFRLPTLGLLIPTQPRHMHFEGFVLFSPPITTLRPA